MSKSTLLIPMSAVKNVRLDWLSGEIEIEVDSYTVMEAVSTIPRPQKVLSDIIPPVQGPVLPEGDKPAAAAGKRDAELQAASYAGEGEINYGKTITGDNMQAWKPEDHTE